MSQLNLQTFTYCIKNKSKSCESQASKSDVKRSGKLEQNITATLSHWNPHDKGRRLDGVTSSCCSWRNALW